MAVSCWFLSSDIDQKVSHSVQVPYFTETELDIIV